MKTVLLVGGTGNLGALIGRELLKRGARLRLLVRPGSRSKVPADLAHAAEIVEDEQTAFRDVFTVVSAVQGGPETIVDAQLRFLRAARQAGVRRFIASDYSMNLFTVPEGDNVSSDHRREFGRRADGERGDVPASCRGWATWSPEGLTHFSTPYMLDEVTPMRVAAGVTEIVRLFDSGQSGRRFVLLDAAG